MFSLFNKFKLQRTEELIYQYEDGSYLPNNNQPNPKCPNKYTPHESTRYINILTGLKGLIKINTNHTIKDIDKKLPELYSHREECCGCTACYADCPCSGPEYTLKHGGIQAIEMLPDEEGFLYPVVNALVCIRCYRCLSICSFKKMQQTKKKCNNMEL